jgi:hypothetical protein
MSSSSTASSSSAAAATAAAVASLASLSVDGSTPLSAVTSATDAKPASSGGGSGGRDELLNDFNRALSDEVCAVPIAACLALHGVVKRTKAATVLELQKELEAAAARLKESIPDITVVTGSDLCVARCLLAHCAGGRMRRPHRRVRVCALGDFSWRVQRSLWRRRRRGWRPNAVGVRMAGTCGW